jgi:DNA-binding response OmpR family regulator
MGSAFGNSENAMRILVIEDQEEILQNIADYLHLHGFTVDCAQNGLGGLHLAVTLEFDLIILDIMLPGMDGLTLCRKLRQEGGVHTPVIFLTARDRLEDKLAGFKAGSDDYLVKPFSLPELHARVEAVLRRSQPFQGNRLQVDDLLFDLDTLQVNRQGKNLKLNPIGLKLLERLMKSSPHVVRRASLQDILWGDDVPDSDSLRSHIHLLRQIIDKSFDTPLIHTIHGIGYCLKADDDEV